MKRDLYLRISKICCIFAANCRTNNTLYERVLVVHIFPAGLSYP